MLDSFCNNGNAIDRNSKSKRTTGSSQDWLSICISFQSSNRDERKIQFVGRYKIKREIMQIGGACISLLIDEKQKGGNGIIVRLIATGSVAAAVRMRSAGFDFLFDACNVSVQFVRILQFVNVFVLKCIFIPEIV